MNRTGIILLGIVLPAASQTYGQLSITDVAGPTGVFRLLTFNDTDIQISPAPGNTGDLNVASLGMNGILEGSYPNAAFRLSSFEEDTSINLTNSIVDTDSIEITSFSSSTPSGINTSISNTILRSSTDISVQGNVVHFGLNSIFDADELTVEAHTLIIDDPMNFFGFGQPMPVTTTNGSGDSLIFKEGIDFTKSITFTSLAPAGGGIWLTFDRGNNVIDENFGFVDIVVSQTAAAVPEPTTYALLAGLSAIIFITTRKYRK